MIATILMVFALVLLLLAAGNVSTPGGRVHLGWLGAACFVAAALLGAAKL